jgi:serine/threonine protein kinase
LGAEGTVCGCSRVCWRCACQVRVAWHKLTGEQVAIKTYEKSKLKDSKHWRRVQQEIRLMEKLNNPRVIRLFETIESPKRIHIVMEYLGGSNLCNYVKSKRRLEEDEARVIFMQIVESLEYIHSLNIVHRDIKLEVGPLGWLEVLCIKSRWLVLLACRMCSLMTTGEPSLWTSASA